ncbi:MAG: glycosyltransferase [Rhodothermales bacterium]
MRFSLLVASRDRPAELSRCVASAARQQGVEAEIVVLDDASATPVARDRLDAGRFPLRLIRSETRLGVGAGRNRLMEEAAGDVFVVLDDDAFFIDDGALRRLAAALEFFPEAGLFALKIRDFRHGRERWLTPHPRRRQTSDLLAQSHRVSYFLGGAHALRREVLERCGPYPTSYVYGNEELDLSFRAIQHGFEIVFLADVEVHHRPPPDEPPGAGEYGERLYHHTRSRLLLAHAHLPAHRATVYSLGWMAVYGVRALRHGAAGAFASAVRDAWRMGRHVPREPIGRAAIAYLRAHFGRLWI